MRADGQVLYCLALEYARHGDLSAFLARGGKGWSRSRRAARDRRHPRGARQAAPRPGAPSRPHAAERLRLRRPAPEARRLRHRPSAERSPRHHRAHDERADGAERHPRARRPEVAGARRRLSGGAAAGDADQGRRAGADPPARNPPARVQRSPEGDRLSLHRRAAEALRERRRDDRGAAHAARRRSRSACCGR